MAYNYTDKYPDIADVDLILSHQLVEQIFRLHSTQFEGSRAVIVDDEVEFEMVNTIPDSLRAISNSRILVRYVWTPDEATSETFTYDLAEMELPPIVPHSFSSFAMNPENEYKFSTPLVATAIDGSSEYLRHGYGYYRFEFAFLGGRSVGPSSPARGELSDYISTDFFKVEAGYGKSNFDLEQREYPYPTTTTTTLAPLVAYPTPEILNVGTFEFVQFNVLLSQLRDGTEVYKGGDVIKGTSEAGIVSDYYYDNDIKSEKVLGIVTPETNECDFLRNPNSDDNSTYRSLPQNFTSTEFYLNAKIPNFSQVLSKLKEQSSSSLKIFVDVEAKDDDDPTFSRIDTYTIDINNVPNEDEKTFILRLDNIVDHRKLIFTDDFFRLILRDEENILLDSDYSNEFSSNRLCNGDLFGEVTTTPPPTTHQYIATISAKFKFITFTINSV